MAFEVAQVAYVKKAGNVRPVLLVDDLSTELDFASIQRLFSLIDALDLQTFVTSVLETVVTLIQPPASTIRLFHVKQGEIRRGR